MPTPYMTARARGLSYVSFRSSYPGSGTLARSGSAGWSRHGWKIACQTSLTLLTRQTFIQRRRSHSWGVKPGDIAQYSIYSMKICYAELAYQSPDLTKACILSAFKFQPFAIPPSLIALTLQEGNGPEWRTSSTPHPLSAPEIRRSVAKAARSA